MAGFTEILAAEIRARAERVREAVKRREQEIERDRALAATLDLVAMRVCDGGLTSEQALAAYAAANPPIFPLLMPHTERVDEATRLRALFGYGDADG